MPGFGLALPIARGALAVRPAAAMIMRRALPIARSRARQIVLTGMTAGGALAGGIGGKLGGLLGVARRGLPVAAGAAAGYGLAGQGAPSFGGRRRAKGITAAELRGARKIAGLLKAYGCRCGSLRAPRKSKRCR